MLFQSENRIDKTLQWLNSLQGISFDLDNTLFDQREFLHGAFAGVAKVVSSSSGHEKERLHSSLVTFWEREPENSRLFNGWLASMGLLTESLLEACIESFHKHHPDALTLYQGVRTMLEQLRSRYRLALITDGNLEMQQTKVECLALEPLVDCIIYTRAFGIEKEKPAPDGFLAACSQMGCLPKLVVHIGDHPKKDIAGASHAGLHSIWVRTGIGAPQSAAFTVKPDLVLDCVTDLVPLLA